MAAPTTAADFLELVRDSGLVEPADLDRHRDRPLPPRRLAEQLVADELLTPFQAEQLLLGNGDVFTIGRYRILDQLGSGSSGMVYRVRQEGLGREVALKVLPLYADVSPSVVQRFRREARALALLDHPNVVQVHDFDQSGDQLFLVMEYVDGVTLYDWVKERGGPGVTAACHYARQAACGLQAIHEAGLVHRDVKPNNMMLDREGTVKILDLGLARFLGDECDSPTIKYDARRVLGTADFLSPEQAMNSHEVDIRADVYSLGATLYFLLTGQTPFPTGTAVQKLLWVQTREPRPVDEVNPEVPSGLAEVVARMMAKERSRRYETPQEVVRALGRWTQTPVGPPDLGRRPAERWGSLSTSDLEATPAPGGRERDALDAEPDDDADLTLVPSVSDLRLVVGPEGKQPPPTEAIEWTAPEDESAWVDLDSGEAHDASEWIRPAPPAAGPAPKGEEAWPAWQVAAVLAALLLSIGLGITLAMTVG